MLLSFGLFASAARLRSASRVVGGVLVAGGNVSRRLNINDLSFGIVLMMFSGFLAFALQPGVAWLGCLSRKSSRTRRRPTLDEFRALAISRTVYWAEERAQLCRRRDIWTAIIAAGASRRVRARDDGRRGRSGQTVAIVHPTGADRSLDLRHVA